jgi:hypothetical protein
LAEGHQLAGAFLQKFADEALVFLTMCPIFATQNHSVSCFRIQMPFYDDEKYAFVSIRQDFPSKS